MPLFEKHLVIKKSTIPGAGKGLFTKVSIPKGVNVVEYKGKISRWKDVDHKGGLNAYIYYVNRNHVIDSSENKNLARYANDAKGSKNVEKVLNNCKFMADNKLRVFIISIKNIAANSEILVGYGKEYWDTITANRNQASEKKIKKSTKKR